MYVSGRSPDGPPGLERPEESDIRIMEGPDWIQQFQPDRCGEHNANSHDDNKSKFLMHEQIVADAVTVAPQQSASQLRRNL